MTKHRVLDLTPHLHPELDRNPPGALVLPMDDRDHLRQPQPAERVIRRRGRRLVDLPVEITTDLRITVDHGHAQVMLRPPATLQDAVGPYLIHARGIPEGTADQASRRGRRSRGRSRAKSTLATGHAYV
jgi:hypothetical protein